MKYVLPLNPSSFIIYSICYVKNVSERAIEVQQRNSHIVFGVAQCEQEMLKISRNHRSFGVWFLLLLMLLFVGHVFVSWVPIEMNAFGSFVESMFIQRS